jgi:hypothetical protein
MAVLRVKAPADTDPHELVAALTRALSTDRAHPLSAELEWLPAWREPRRRSRRLAFVAVLSGPQPESELVRVADRCARRTVRGRYGKKYSARVRPAGDPEVSALWCAFRGTPHRTG